MCPFGTGTAEASGEGERPVNTLKNCAKTAAKNNVREAREHDEFPRVHSGSLAFDTTRARPPCMLQKRARTRVA